jgi:nucleoside phosphorylase
MKEEAGPFRKATAANSRVEILITGIGRINSERALRKRLSFLPPGVVFSCGFAGGLDPDLPVGEVLFETGDSALREHLLAAGARAARFHCADRIAVTVAEKRELRQRTDADAVEMESLMIHAVCREQQIPCATVRAISDTAAMDLPLDFNKLAKPDLNLDYGKLALAILKSPGRIPGLLALQRNSGQAATALSQTLIQVLG